MMLTRLHAVHALLLTSLTFSASPASAALCPTEFLTPTTATSFNVRQIVEQNECTAAETQMIYGEGCDAVEWGAVTYGNIPNNGDPIPGIEVRFFYTSLDWCTPSVYFASHMTLQISQSYLDAHPEGFVISSAQQVPSGDGVTWTINPIGVGTPPPMLIEGTVTPAGNGNVRVDVTLGTGDGTEVTPVGAITDLIEFIGGAPAIDGGVENALLASLEAAIGSIEAGNLNAAVGQLNALINKVEAVRSKKIFDEVADDIIAAATEILALLQ